MLQGKNRLFIIIGAGVVVLLAIAITAIVLAQPKPAVIEAPVVDPRPVTVAEPQPAPEPEPVAPTWPLTGLPLSDPALANNRPLCVKIENSMDARPQSGLAFADVVYETLTEGGITRFNCIFQSTIPEEVGPVRSARNSDITIVPQYQGVLFFSGANNLVLSQLISAGVPNVVHGSDGGIFYRVSYREAPHNLYLQLPGAYGAAEAKGYPTTVDKPATLQFATDGKPAPAGTAVTSVRLPFSDYSVAEWSWDATARDGAGAWLRSMDDPTIDATIDAQVGATNVVVMWAHYTPDTVGGDTLEVSLVGSGSAAIFTQGQQIDGTWETDGTTPPRFKDAQGNSILLTPGNTWFSVLENGTAISSS